MTKGDARAAYLRYLGERTVNGSPRADLDLNDVFDGLLDSSVTFVAASFPNRATLEIDRDALTIDFPEKFAYVIRTLDEHGNPVAYQRVAYRLIFERECTMEYALRPDAIPPGAEDATEIDLEDRYARLVPIKAAIDAALGLEEYAYKVPTLTQIYNTMAEALDDANMPTYRRVY